jgi:hypothetical protein
MERKKRKKKINCRLLHLTPGPIFYGSGAMSGTKLTPNRALANARLGSWEPSKLTPNLVAFPIGC